jgi:hypothetical protein
MAGVADPVIRSAMAEGRRHAVPSRGERPHIGQVAELAGVSATTVSHALNGRRPVSAATRQRVLDAIEQLGYRPNVVARGLRAGRSMTIGLVIPDINNPFYPLLARGMQDMLDPADYDAIIANTNGDRELERAALDKMISRQVDAIAFAVFDTHAEDLQPVIDAGIPALRLGGGQHQQHRDGDRRAGHRPGTCAVPSTDRRLYIPLSPVKCSRGEGADDAPDRAATAGRLRRGGTGRGPRAGAARAR